MLFSVFHYIGLDRLKLFDESAFKDFPKDYVRVAVVEAPVLGAVFELTNHIHDNWTKGPAVVTLDSDPNRTRSTSVGDVIVDGDDNVMGVAGVGFTRLGQLKRCWYCGKPVYDWEVGSDLTNGSCPSCQQVRARTEQWAKEQELDEGEPTGLITSRYL